MLILIVVNQCAESGNLKIDCNLDKLEAILRKERLKQLQLKLEEKVNNENIIIVIKGDPDFPGYKEQELTLTKGKIDETTGRVPDEYDEYTVRSDFDGKMKDIDEGLEDIDDLIEDTIGFENVSIKELEDMGYDINRLSPGFKKKLGIK